jgi:hypothetical protein
LKVLSVIDSGPLPLFALIVMVAGAAVARLDAVPPAVVVRFVLLSVMPFAAVIDTVPAKPAFGPVDEEIWV